MTRIETILLEMEVEGGGDPSGSSNVENYIGSNDRRIDDRDFKTLITLTP